MALERNTVSWHIMEQNVGNDEIKQDAEAHNLDTEKLVSFSYIVDDDHSKTTCNLE